MLPSPLDLLPQKALTIRDLDRGDHAFRQDAPARGPFFVVSGAVEMIRHSESGVAVTIHRAAAGETLAEPSLFSERYHCDCVAAAPSRLIGLSKAAVMELFATDADFAAALLRRLAGQVQTYRRRIEILSVRSAEDRVRAALAEFGQQGSVMSFAGEIGLSHEATYRALSALVRQGAARRIGRGRYVIA